MKTAASAGGLNNLELAIFALYKLGGVKRKVHLEEIAHKCHELAPKRFGWELPQFRQFPDRIAVYYALDEACKKRRGELVDRVGTRGKGGKRFHITLAGVKWIKENTERIDLLLGKKALVEPKREVRDFLRRVKGDPAFRRFRAEGESIALSTYDLIDFLGIPSETSPTAIRRKFDETKAQAELVEDDEIRDFLLVCESKLPQILHKGGSQ